MFRSFRFFLDYNAKRNANAMHKTGAKRRTIMKNEERSGIMAAFQIPRTPHTTNKTIRFPDDVIADVEAAIAGKDCTFSAFVIAAVRSALAQLAESPEA